MGIFKLKIIKNPEFIAFSYKKNFFASPKDKQLFSNYI